MQRARHRGGATDEEAEAALNRVWGSTRGDVPGGMLSEMMLVGVGGMFLAYATWRYFQVQAALLRGAFPVNRVGVRVRRATDFLPPKCHAGVTIETTPRWLHCCCYCCCFRIRVDMLAETGRPSSLRHLS